MKFDGGIKKINQLARFETKTLCSNSSDNGRYVVLALRDPTIALWETNIDKLHVIELPVQLQKKKSIKETMEGNLNFIKSLNFQVVKQIYVSDDAQYIIIITTTNTPWLYDSSGITSEWLMLPSHFVETDPNVNNRLSFSVQFSHNSVRDYNQYSKSHVSNRPMEEFAVFLVP